MTVSHATFTVTRDYRHRIENVFHAFADEATKRSWAAARHSPETDAFKLDFRVDGREFSAFHLPDAPHLPPEVRGQRITNEAVYHDIVEGERIVYSYRMTIGGACMSVSLATVEFNTTSTGTQLTFTEQGSYFDNADGAAMRQQGWNELLDGLGKALSTA